MSPRPMPLTDAMFLIAETREQPMHVGALQLFDPPAGADAVDVRRLFETALAEQDVAPLNRRRPVRSLRTGYQWAWEDDDAFDLEHHIRHSALPTPGRVLELLALCSRLHGTLLDRHRPLWEMHYIEGLRDGRLAVYFKYHHALMDGVSGLRLLQQSLSRDPDARGLPAPWAVQQPAGPDRAGPTDDAGRESGDGELAGLLRAAMSTMGRTAGAAAGLAPALVRSVDRAVREQSASMSFSAPRTMFNVPITGGRRFAAQSWPLGRLKQVAKGGDATLNDVVLALCSGALRTYLSELNALPDAPLIAMVPVSLRRISGKTGGGNALGVIMCNLGTDCADPAARLSTVRRSMQDGKALLGSMTPLQILAMSAIGLSPLVLNPLLGIDRVARPPFNLVISNVPGPRRPLYWNGARLDGLYPLSVPFSGLALNITVTSYSDRVAFGLTGCRRTVPHLQRMLGFLDAELSALEDAVGGG